MRRVIWSTVFVVALLTGCGGSAGSPAAPAANAPAPEATEPPNANAPKAQMKGGKKPKADSSQKFAP